MRATMSKANPSIVYLKYNNVWYCYDSSRPPLGAGSLGVVYLGFRCDNQERVAIKKIHEAYVNNAQIRSLVYYEASMVFDHPKIVKMIGLCENANGGLYLICEYVPGVTLADRARQLGVASHNERVRQVVEDISAILPALEHMHNMGFIHRDIKPSNIMVDNSSNVKLMDLGIAVAMHLTQYGSIREFVGTPEYASPEQVQCGYCDGRSDIYSLGVTMYELLTDANPLIGKTQEDTFYQQLQLPLPANDMIPDALYKIIEKATNKLPEHRYSTANEMNQALLDYLNQAQCPDTQNSKIVGFDIDVFILGLVIVAIVVVVLFFMLFY